MIDEVQLLRIQLADHGEIITTLRELRELDKAEIERLTADNKQLKDYYAHTSEALRKAKAENERLQDTIRFGNKVMDTKDVEIEQLRRSVEIYLAENTLDRADNERLKAKIKVIEEAATAAYRYHMLGYKDAGAFNANVMLDHMNKLGEVL